MKNNKMVYQLIENLENAKSFNSLEKASNACIDYFLVANSEEKELLKNAILKRGKKDIEHADKVRKSAEIFLAQINKPKTIIEVEGVKYPLTEWLTIKEYCNIYGLKTTSIVTNWTKRGIIPKANILYLPQLNLRLIKAEKYM